MIRSIQTLIKRKKLKLVQKDNRFYRTFKFYKGVVISVILIAIPFTYHLYLSAPGDKDYWNTFFGTIIVNEYWNDVQSYLYQIINKLTLLLFLSIWYFTSKNWWKYSLLVPVSIYLFQLAAIFNDNYEFVDQFEFIHSLPITIPIIAAYIYFAIKLKDKANKLDISEQINFEIKKALQENE